MKKLITKADADSILRDIGRLEDRIAAIHAIESEAVRQANERAVAQAKPLIEARLALVEALEEWARSDGAEHFEHGSRSLPLTFGRLFFRLSPPAIRLVRKVEYVIQRLRAKRMIDCIRVKEEVNKEALLAYDVEDIKDVGCKRVQKDEFHYEVYRPEVK